MKKFINFVLSTLFLILPIGQTPALAQGEAEPESGAVVCAPDAYPTPPDDCLPLGPSVYLTELAGLGLIIPPRPLHVRKPDPSLTQVPYRYFHLDQVVVPVLNGPAGDPSGPAFGAGFVYVTYL